MSVAHVIAHVKALLVAWQDGGAAEALESARPCPCGCPFRHKHGGYSRFVVVGTEEYQVFIPRLCCPVCGRTAVVPPPFLRPRSPYPHCFQQAAVLTYLAGQRGYRPVAADFLLAWQVLWQWVDRLAGQAKGLLACLTGLLLQYPPTPAGLPGPAMDSLRGTVRETEAYRGKARGAVKREGLAAIGAALAQAHRLWQTGAALGLPWGEPDPTHLLGFLDVCEKLFR